MILPPAWAFLPGAASPAIRSSRRSRTTVAARAFFFASADPSGELLEGLRVVQMSAFSVRTRRELMATSTQPLDVDDLRGKVQHMYEAVARHPHVGPFHFEMGRALAERLGYPAGDLDRVPAPAIESFAGVGYYFDLAAVQPGEHVVDLGSGSGMDAFIAALRVGATGRVIGIEMTDAQREKASELARRPGFAHAEFRSGLIEEIPLVAGNADCVISNGVINLCPDKPRVFAEAARVLRPGGRLAIADIVTDRPLPANVTC